MSLWQWACLRRLLWPLHLARSAETAEQLMRSRYTAFALGNVDYLIATLGSGDPLWRGVAENSATAAEDPLAGA